MGAIYILDRVSLPSKSVSAYQQAMRDRYLPGALERGMEWVGSWVTPPVELEEGNEFVTLWSLPNIEAFWAMRAANAAPEVMAWWAESDRMTQSRERKIMTRAEIS
ncbi:MAG: hypothetical protein GY910_27670 [bacterium]|nr:hypothetical protein [Deltaproteobacteria bacterium]MCP4908772.1 hypothetical protein [bacterium]